jgi:hypothetical protein
MGPRHIADAIGPCDEPILAYVALEREGGREGERERGREGERERGSEGERESVGWGRGRGREKGDKQRVISIEGREMSNDVNRFSRTQRFCVLPS